MVICLITVTYLYHDIILHSLRDPTSLTLPFNCKRNLILRLIFGVKNCKVIPKDYRALQSIYLFTFSDDFQYYKFHVTNLV